MTQQPPTPPPTNPLRWRIDHFAKDGPNAPLDRQIITLGFIGEMKFDELRSRSRLLSSLSF
jgi:hypothetical protein